MKELIIQSLETKGVLGQIRAHLRSAVFKVVDEQDQQFNTGCGLKWENKTLYKILETKIGTLLAEIIREFMEYFRMDYSLSIFIPECGISPERLNRKEILGKLGIMNNPQNDKFTAGLHLPLLYYIEAKSDELIENNMTEYFKNQKMEEENIPLSNNSRDVNPPSGKSDEKKEEKKEEIKEEIPKEKKEEVKNEIKEEKKEVKKEEKKEEIPKEKKEEKKQVLVLMLRDSLIF